MGLTKRQEEMIGQIIIEESRAAHKSQQERHRILDGIDAGDLDVLEEAPRAAELTSAVRHALVDLVETFYHDNRLYEGVELDDGRAAKRATHFLYSLIEADLKETVDMLQSGDFDDLDQAEERLPPMHPRSSGKPGGVTGGTGHVEVGEEPTGMRSTMPEPKAGGGYPGGGDEDVELPPMHPRGRR
jgi:hypothetical protein